MLYSNSEVRRQDRLLSESKAQELLSTGEYGVLSVCCGENEVYGVPLNFVWDGKHSIYLHCAPAGRKLDCIDKHSSVSFCVVGMTQVMSDKFTTEYESIVLKCEAFRNLPDEERMQALRIFIDKYSPDDIVIGEKYAEKSFHRTEIIRLDIDKWSGKSKSMK